MATKASKPASENKLSENIGSIILGFVVVLILGGFLLNVFRENRGEVGDSTETAEEETESTENNTYTVQPGDTLWLIAERETGSGFNWQAIAEANNLESADDIEEGMELVIPEVTGDMIAEGEPTTEPTAEPTTTTTSEEPTVTATIAPTRAPTDAPEVTSAPTQPKEGEYTVQTGDSLWKIAAAQYNDGYKWVEIAQANGLENPDIIHAGNVLKLP